MDVCVATLEFKLFRLERWWVAFDQWDKFCPEGRVHLGNGWFWNKT